jgi:octaprenyl-diphosphate synthase
METELLETHRSEGAEDMAHTDVASTPAGRSACPPRNTANGKASSALIADDLEAVERILHEELASADPYIQGLIAHLGHYRGKRLRPALLLLAARACGRVTPEHRVLAAVVEMVHTATLVHDDILDNAALRRHVETVHHKWGRHSAVLLGDLLFTHAFYLASTTGSALACRLIGRATNRVCEGELRQIGQEGNLDLDEDDYFAMIRGKTAELTACACRLGAVFAGAGEPIVDGLARYGLHLGIAFQIADDLLDLVGSEARTGKSLGTDLAQAKLTLPLIHLLRQSAKCGDRRHHELLAAPGNHKLDALLPALADAGSLAYAQRQADEHAQRARRELICLSPSPARQLLEDWTIHAVQREC